MTLSIILPPVIIVIVPVTAIKKPTAAAVPIDFLMSYPKVLINGTIKDPPPIPKGTDINPIITPEIFFTIAEICFGLSTNFSLKKIKNNPTISAKIEKNKTNAGVFKFTAKEVPPITPAKIKTPNDLTILKSTASYYLWVIVEMIEVGIIIASDVPTERCILVTISNSKTVKA